MAIMSSNIIICMEKRLSALETKLPTEIQRIILTYIVLNKAQTFSQVLEKVNTLVEKSIFSKCIKDEDFIVDLAKTYIATHKSKVNSVGRISIELLYFIQDIYKENIPAIKALIKAGIDVNTYIGPDDTILMLALKGNCKEAVRVLIDAGANVNAQNGWYDTPLIIATIQGNQEMVKILLDADADITAKNNHGTAECFAKHLGFTEITEMLQAAVKK